MANKITTVFDAQTKKFSSGVKSIKKDIAAAEGATNKFKAGWAGAMAEFKNNRAAQVAVAGVVIGIGTHAVNAASDLEESINAVNVTFGDAAEGVLKVGENAAESFGLSKSEFNKLAVQFSAFAKQVAGPGGDVTAVIGDMTTRVADFASVMDIDVAEAGQVFQSTLAGQTEPIRKYGKDVSAAAVTHYALEKGLVASKSEMTEAIKVQARYGLLMEQTADTAGDFANTSDSLANSQRRLTSQITDLSAKLGAELTPAVADAVGQMSDLVSLLDDVDGFMQGIEANVPGSASAFDFLKPSFDVLGELDKVGKVGNPLRFVTDPLTEKGFKGIWGAIKGTGDAAEDSGADLDHFTGRLRESTDGVDAAATKVALLRGEQENLRRTTEHLGGTVGELRGREENLRRTTEHKAQVDRDAAAAADKHADAVSDLVDEINGAIDTAFDYEEATIALDRAVLDLAEQEEATAEVMADGEASDRDRARSTYELRDAQIEVAKKAIDTALAFVAERDAGLSVEESSRLQRDELERLKAKYGDLGPEIDAYIDKLGQIPRDINTVVRLSGGRTGTTNKVGQVTSFTSGGFTGLAEGGIVKARPGGTPAIIGEGGHDEAVIPLNKAGGALGGGGHSYTINVTAGMGADGTNIGKQVVSAIKQYERTNGTRWRQT